ncbi:hypothetical protein JN535_08505 [Cellulosimicrobium cellulans]|uniref:hypothetical protein n=1 Tax=Cellulosimicrobium cellulans TaxID=1710 RepID=UPI0019663050|nr:hypothetical protein [Cellulosimicrobium cellulans]MBN0040206.1 hypothetical protein [Cellulosimicrobium cellulans]
MSTDQTPALARATEADNNGVGWYEVIHPTTATTLLAYVHEDGSVYFPETNDGRAEFEFAAARGNVHRLVRADDAEHAHATVSAALEVDEMAALIWETSRRDEGTISATGAKHVAQALRAHLLGDA